MTTRLNLNTKVTVRLTEYGRTLMLASGWASSRTVPPVGEPYTEQLWVLMNALGPGMEMGFHPAVEGNDIEIGEVEKLPLLPHDIPVSRTTSCTVGNLSVTIDTAPDGTRTRTVTETVRPGEPFRDEMKAGLQREQDERAARHVEAAEALAKECEKILSFGIRAPEMEAALVAYRSL